MPASEFAEWKLVHDKLDPFGEERKDLRAGTVASPLINIQLAKGAERTKPSDWICDFDKEPPPPQSPEQQKAILKGLAMGMKRQAERKVKKPRRRREHS